MNAYTVLLLYPDYLTDNFGHDTYMASVCANNVTDAIAKARQCATDDNRSAAEDPEDFHVLCVIAGNVDDIKDQAIYEQIQCIKP